MTNPGGTPTADSGRLRLYRAWGGCEHHANYHKAYAESAAAFVELIKSEYGYKYPLSEPEELATEPHTLRQARAAQGVDDTRG